MFKIAIILLISGVLCPYIGMWFAGTYMLGNGPVPNFFPMQIASMFSILLSVGLICLTKIERNIFLKIMCVLVSLAYPISGIAYMYSTQNTEYCTWLFTTGFFFKNCIAALVAVLVFRNCRLIHDEV